MSSFESFDPSSLGRLDDYELELRRYEFVINVDDRREEVILEMLRRALDRIGIETARLGKAAGLSLEQIGSRAEEVAVKLAMRLRTPRRLKPLNVLVLELASEAVGAAAPQPQTRPALIDRRPELHAVQADAQPAADADSPATDSPPGLEQRLADEIRRKRIKPNDPDMS